MPGPLLLLFDDDAARGWEPFASTRPAAELRVGAATLRE
ncbi:MAG: putative sugar nucleotidyl transferase, partial [Gemmatimonadota bacterium]